jgi:hydrogenase expression/formation protein HypD
MRFIDEYRDEKAAKTLSDRIRLETTRPWTLMEICGGQTHTIIKYGIDSLLPETIRLIHGPGCPVCVTPIEMIDKAIRIASRPEVILTSFGDMLRVPGSRSDLLSAKADGGAVRMVYSPLDAVEIARRNPDRQVVFFAVGFETTAPASAMAVWQAERFGILNFSILCAHVLVPPAMNALLSRDGNGIDGFLAAGHVCTVTGYEEYIPIAKRYRVPIVVTGFEPVDILQGIEMTVRQLEAGRTEVENQYARSVRKEGNPAAKRLLSEVFEATDRRWRGIGSIPLSGYRLRPDFREFDAERRFDLSGVRGEESTVCIAGEILQGMKRPGECPAFGTQCNPEHPLGAPMVSSEGACAAYYQYGRFASAEARD